MLDDAVSMFVSKRKRRTRQKTIMVDKRHSTGQEVEAKMWNIYKDTKNSYTFYNYKMDLNNATKAIQSAKRSLEKNSM